jgi:SAM-dependent methyltransferase
VELSRDGAQVRQRPQSSTLHVPLVLDPWLRELIVDPISKQPFLTADSGGFLSPCGFRYSYKKGTPDFRVRLGAGGKTWAQAQEAFSHWFSRYLELGETSDSFYPAEQQRDKRVYETIPLEGRVIDIGGQLGHIRKYMSSNQQYCSIDPFIDVHLLVSGRKNLFANYPLYLPLNFLGGFAEFLPIRDQSFDTVNMRSCIDHFFNPAIALMEAFRITRKRGRLIVGLKIEGHTLKSTLMEIGKGIAGTFVSRYKDHHIWHPSYSGLMALCSGCGFDLEKEYWQTRDILYASFIRRDIHSVTMQD